MLSVPPRFPAMQVVTLKAVPPAVACMAYEGDGVDELLVEQPETVSTVVAMMVMIITSESLRMISILGLGQN